MIDTKEIAMNFCGSCIEYEQKADQKLARKGTIVLAGEGCVLKVINGALIINHGSTHIPRSNRA
jgi:hypothetical protein